jgi:hypothetical protein
LTLKVGQYQSYTHTETLPCDREPHAKLEDLSDIITQDIKHNAKLGQWPIAILKAGQGQRYTQQNFGFG